jgi:hypothetical protein
MLGCHKGNHLPFPTTASLKTAHIAAWIVLLGCIAGIAFRPTGGDGFWAILILVVLLDLIVIIVLNWWIRSRLAATLPRTEPIRERSLIFVAIAALTWGMLDAFFFGQAGISIVLCVAGVLYFPLRALQARKDGARLKLRLSEAAVTSIMGFAALGIIVYGNVIARERAETLIVAVEQFHAKHGRYPKRLEEVVPVFISEIPRAKYVALAEKFRYFVSDSRHSLMYVEIPPFGRRIYTFEDRKWMTLD